jgi:tetratricopeptide (TPR) repeat protein
MSKSNALTKARKRHAQACAQANRTAEALALYQKLCETDPADAESWYMAGMLYGRLERFAEAEAALRKAVALQPKSAQGHFSLGRLYDRYGDYAKAFPQFAAGNALKRARFDRGAWERKITDLMAIFNRDALARAPRAGNCSERPIFIVGMPCSGITPVEQALAVLPDAAAAGALPDIGALAMEMQVMLEDTSPANNITQITRAQCDGLAQRYLDTLDRRFPKAVRWLDKQAHNFLHLGLIALLFPMARVIHCLRDPLDTCLSCYFQDFPAEHPYGNDLGDLGHCYRQYRRLMAHWRKALDLALFEINYEDLVREPLTCGRALVEFCGFKWDPRYLEFYRGERLAAAGAVGRWRRYDEFLQPLRDALGEAVPRL